MNNARQEKKQKWRGRNSEAMCGGKHGPASVERTGSWNWKPNIRNIIHGDKRGLQKWMEAMQLHKLFGLTSLAANNFGLSNFSKFQ